MDVLPVAAGLLVTLTNWRSYFIGALIHDMKCIPFTNCSHRVTGCQNLSAVVLRALIDSELGMFRILWSGMCRAKIKRWQSARRSWWTLTWWGVWGGRRVDLRQGGIATAGAGLLGGASLWKRGGEGGREESAAETTQELRWQRCKQTNHHVTVRARLLSQ